MAASTYDPLSGAMRQNALATGAPLYGAGRSNAATSGPLPPEGYLQRSQNNQAKQLALQRKLALLGQQPGSMTPTSPGGI